MTKPPGHTCPLIDRTQRDLRRMLRTGRLHPDDARILDRALLDLERVREENTQMRKAHAEAVDALKARRHAERQEARR